MIRIGAELLRYGYRVAVLVLPAPPQLHTPEALAVVGPRAFGYDVEYRPVEWCADRDARVTGASAG